MEERKITRELIEAFSLHLIRQEKSSGTISKYVHDVTLFAEWMQGERVLQEHTVQWKNDLVESGRMLTTVNSMIAAVNSFFRYVKWGYHIKYVRIQKRFFRADEKVLTRSDYDKLLKTAYRQGKESLGLLMETICATGIRVSEIRYITMEAARSGRAEILLKGKHRTILIPDKLCRKLKRYAAKRGIRRGELFLNKRGKSMDRKQIWSQMKALCKFAGVSEKKVFPHNLRHLFARAFYRASKDITGLADVLGHSSIETTRIYLVSTETERIKKIAQLKLVL